MTAGINERLSRTYLGAASQVGRDTLMLNTPMPMRHRETEAAVPLTVAPEAVRRVLGLFADGRPAVSFPLEIRFVRGDDSMDESGAGRGHLPDRRLHDRTGPTARRTSTPSGR